MENKERDLAKERKREIAKGIKKREGYLKGGGGEGRQEASIPYISRSRPFSFTVKTISFVYNYFLASCLTFILKHFIV